MIDRDALRALFLFQQLTDLQLDRLVRSGELRAYDAGAPVTREGDPATTFLVLLEGRMRLSRQMGGEDVVVNETDHRGAYGGAVRAYVEDDERYSASITALSPARFFALPAREFGAFVREEFPMAVHLLDGLYVGIRNSESQVRQREHLASLGTLSAHLAHELNNPAAASVRASAQLRARVAAAQSALARLAEDALPADAIRGLVRLAERAVEQAGRTDLQPTPVALADREDELADRLDELGVADALELAPVLAAAGLDAGWLDQVMSCVDEARRAVAVRWLACAVETAALLDELEDCATRISTLVASVKDYSRMDAASEAEIDLHPGLDSTLVMLSAKLAGLRVVKEYDRTLPAVPAHPAELNQVWTNLLDNAAAALDGRGTVTVRTRREGNEAVVEVADDGPGIAPEVLPRIFEAFFTTKPVGSGSGLGLDSVQRIVQRRHGGRVDVDSAPGAGTVFRVRLPLERQR